MTFYQQIKHIPPGYSEVIYRDRKYGISRTDHNKGKVIKIYAEELGGTDFISFNYYITTNTEYIKPCEMPQEKVIDFLNTVF